MAIFSKKLRLKKNGVLNEEVYNIYSTVAEVMPKYAEVSVDGMRGYIPLVNTPQNYTGSLKASVDSTLYSFLTKAGQPYNFKIYNVPGTYTFTVPEYIFKVRVKIIGGGGGAANSGRGSGSYHNDAIGGTGGASSFGSLTSTGGGGGHAWCYWTTDWEGYQYEYTYGHSAGSAGSPSGRAGVRGGDNSAVSGGAGFQLLDDKTYGTGGACGAPNNTKRYWDLMGSGGSGGYRYTTVDVTPLSTITVVVGAGGAGDNNNRESTSYAYSGTGGAVQIEWGEGIS